MNTPAFELERRANSEIAALQRTVAILEQIATLAQRPELPVGVQRRLINHVADELGPYRARIGRLQRMRASTAAGRNTPWFRDGDAQ